MNETEWLWTMKKPQVPLAQGLHVIAIPLMQKNLGISTDLPIKHVNGDIYFGKKEVKEIFNRLKENISKDPKLPDKIEKRIRKTVKNIEKINKELEGHNLKNCDNQELLNYFMKGYNIIAEITAFMSFKCTVQMSDVLEEKIKVIIKKRITDVEERNNIFLIISLPKEESLMTKERKSIIKVQTKKDLDKHTKNFAWMGCVMYAGKPFTREHFAKELKQIKSITQKDHTREIKETIQKLHLSKEELNVIDQFRTWTHLRTYVKDMTSVGMYSTLPYLEEIAKQVKVTYKDLLYLNHTELQEIFSNKDLVKESKKRQKGWGFVLIKGKAKYYNYKTVKQIEESEESIPAGVKGFSACKGIVRGKAIVIKTARDLDKISEGDILITHMTTTNFVPILSKVSAIVTDEGGITCHAAIISREMNIPCIIGTRFATKAFKDGDIVEVDAEKGVVKRVIK